MSQLQWLVRNLPICGRWLNRYVPHNIHKHLTESHQVIQTFPELAQFKDSWAILDVIAARLKYMSGKTRRSAKAKASQKVMKAVASMSGL